MNRSIKIVLIVLGIIIYAGLVVGAYYFGKSKRSSSNATTVSSSGSPNQEISVKATGAKYKTVSAKPTSGWLQTGQDADIMLSGIDFNNTGGPLLFNHPGVVASDGTHLLLPDRNNNRVLIWNKLPTGNTPPDIVLGQKDFTANNSGTGLDQMNWPVSVSVGGGKLTVTDSYNNRILIWNSFPTKNGQAADLVINSAPEVCKDCQKDKKRSIQWPWGVWTDGKKLAVSATGANQILIWNNFPTQTDQPADIYLTGKGDIGTPRTITSDGNHLFVGDHNSRAKVANQPKGNSGASSDSQGNFFWKNWPTQDDEAYSFFMSDPVDPKGVWMQGGITGDGKLLMLGAYLHIWNSFPENAGDKPDLSVGQARESSGGDGYDFKGGDGAGLAVAGDHLYLSLSNSNKIVGFNSLPTKSSAKPDFAIGAPDIDTNTLDTNFIMSNPVPVTDGKSLFVSSDFDGKLYVWKNLPDESNAHPDFVYSLTDGPGDNALFGNVLALVGRNSVLIWNKLPLNGELPDSIFTNKIGNVQFQNLGVAMDSKYFYLSDNSAGKIYVWEGVPSAKSNPKFTINADNPGRLSSDGKYLVVTQTLSKTPGGSISIYAVDDLLSSAKPLAVLGGPNKFNLPQKASISQEHLFVGDTGNSRALIWKNIEDAIAGKNADVILGAENLTDTTPEIGKDKLFWPGNLAFDGSFLWIGEFKFSERLLRFSIK